MTELSTSIQALREQGLSYRAIEQQLGCSKGTISYHLGEGQKQKTAENIKRRRASSSLIRKTENFKFGVSKGQRNKKITFQSDIDGKNYIPTFTFGDVAEKIGSNPICYLTGRAVNLEDSSSFHFDHIIPRSKGGDNSLENLGIADRDANRAKHDLSVSELLQLCEEILTHHGYAVSLPQSRLV